MKRLAIVVAAAGLSSALIASPLGAAGLAGKISLRIDVKGQGHASGTGTFELIEKPLNIDSGKVAYSFSFGPEQNAPNGQFGATVRGTQTLTGGGGQLVIHSNGRTAFTGAYEIWTGTWTIGSGTGKYADLKGGGGFVAVIVTSTVRFSFRYEGFATKS